MFLDTRAITFFWGLGCFRSPNRKLDFLSEKKSLKTDFLAPISLLRIPCGLYRPPHASGVRASVLHVRSCVGNRLFCLNPTRHHALPLSKRDAVQTTFFCKYRIYSPERDGGSRSNIEVPPLLVGIYPVSNTYKAGVGRTIRCQILVAPVRDSTPGVTASPYNEKSKITTSDFSTFDRRFCQKFANREFSCFSE